MPHYEKSSTERLLSGAPRSVMMQHILQTVERIAVSDLGVLISGEPSTGKEWIARMIHGCSGRSAGPFVRVDCAALPQRDLEIKIFGSEVLTLSGIKVRSGALEQASGGTIFFDQIAKLPAGIIAKIARMLEYQDFRRVGGYDENTPNVRVIASLHKNYGESSTGKNFRSDLYYRITPVLLNLPPLRERPGDIPFFIEKFISESPGSSQHWAKAITSAALYTCLMYDWPGNIRELKDAIRYASIMCADQYIQPGHLPMYLIRRNRQNGEALKTRGMLHGEPLERLMIEHALKTSTTRSEVASQLGMSVETLSSKLLEYELNLDPRIPLVDKGKGPQ
ncbi:MAG TPA: sigma 54-interacting transcriptional regulator [Bacteroidota bacterium]|nr:sigma 54-interacting transcriptional regulator [Bacteroidota bacterium]